MATNKNITMKQFNGTDYDTLYPKTIVEQVDGVYNKQEILEDTTKSMFGYGSSAIPDTIFQWLGKYNQYWWKRRAVGAHTEEVRTEKIAPTVITHSSSKSTTRTIQYADTIAFDSNNAPYLVNPVSIDVSWSNYNSTLNNILGKYVKNIYASASTIYYVPLTTNFSDDFDNSDPYYETLFTSTIYSITGTTVTDKGSWNYLNSSNRNAYPDSGIGDAYHYEAVLSGSATGYLVATNTGNSSLQNTIYYSDSITIDTSGNVSLENEQSVSIGYSSTTAANALKGKYIRGVMNVSYEVDSSTVYYIPSDASDATSRWDTSYTPAIALMISMQKVTTQQVVDTNAYEYQYLGIPFDNAVNGAKIEVQSYTGTGLFSSTNANSLVFDFEPLLLIIASASSQDLMLAVNYNGKNVGFSMISGAWNSFSADMSNPKFTWGKTVSWYSTKNAIYQMNFSGTEYVVYAFR